MDNDWLLNFDRPDDKAIEALGRIVRELVPKERSALVENAKLIIGRIAKFFALSEANDFFSTEKNHSMDLDLLLSELHQILEIDYQKNLENSANVAWKFEYGARFEQGRTQLAVLTRLRCPEKLGDVMYGRFVECVGPGEYEIWIDDSRDEAISLLTEALSQVDADSET